MTLAPTANEEHELPTPTADDVAAAVASINERPAPQAQNALLAVAPRPSKMPTARSTPATATRTEPESSAPVPRDVANGVPESPVVVIANAGAPPPLPTTAVAQLPSLMTAAALPVPKLFGPASPAVPSPCKEARSCQAPTAAPPLLPPLPPWPSALTATPSLPSVVFRTTTADTRADVPRLPPRLVKSEPAVPASAVLYAGPPFAGPTAAKRDLPPVSSVGSGAAPSEPEKACSTDKTQPPANARGEPAHGYK